MLLTEDPGSIPRSCRLPNKLSLQWKGRPVVKSTATPDLRLIRGGLRHPVSLVADEIPPYIYLGVLVLLVQRRVSPLKERLGAGRSQYRENSLAIPIVGSRP